MKPRLSIIVPVYNTEKYLEKCLSSILNGSFQDFEVIVINDGTKDNSEDIILKYVESHKDKIVYISKENSGLSDTRNIGIAKAKGEYIAFIDSDDYIEPNMYEEMIKKLEEYPYDMVACDVKLVYEESNKTGVVFSGINKDVKDENLVKETLITAYPTAWNKIYKTEIVKKHKFLKGVWYEDVEFMLRIYPDIKSIGVVKKPLYDYLQRKNSITYTYNDKLYDIINNMIHVVDVYKKEGNFDEYKDELEYTFARYSLATFTKRLAKCGDRKKYLVGINYAINKVNEYFPNYKQNKCLNKMGLKGLYIKHFGKFLANINYIVAKFNKYN